MTTTHRREVRPRYGRIAALSSALTITVVAALATMGVFTSGTASAGATPGASDHTSSPTTQSDATDTLPARPLTSTGVTTQDSATRGLVAGSADAALPADSGTGRRVVFSQDLQQVWLVNAKDAVKRTYPVSGSVTDNLQPGTYSVYSRSRWAVGVDDSGVMQYFVRFTKGPTGAAIGFHTIPTQNGVPLQTAAELGTPQSHGCIRQRTPDAIALWNYAPVGTKVVVVA
jgi:lipoprotein-anchoring transpeptidase ErfK/SrfK